MKSVWTIVLLSAIITDPGKIGEINAAKTEARKAYVAGDYRRALEKYRYLTDSLEVTEDEVTLNLAHAYFQLNDTTNAVATYETLVGSPKPAIRSKAQQQLGILHHKEGKLKEALNNFKQAIKADPNNMDARYNYEMLKKKLDEQNQQNQDQQNKDQQKNEQQKNDQKNKEEQEKEQQKKQQEEKEKEQQEQQKQEQQKKDQEQKDKENKDQQSKEEQDKDAKEQQQKEEAEKEKQDKKENSPQLSEKLQQMKISEEKAKMILEAMKNQEIQYLQQNKRKATQNRDKSKPDW